MDLQEWVSKLKKKLLGFGVKEWGMLLVAGICCLVIVFPFGKGEEEETKETIQKQAQRQETETVECPDYAEQLEQRLAELLSSVKDVGRVKVMITVSGSVEKQILQDGTKEAEQSTEQDSAGGSRTSVSERSEGTTVFYSTGGESSPYVLSESYPEITGVVVLAEGSGKGTVDYDILNAVQVLFDVPAHKIKIMKLK
ncbi:MAG: hypothetical protein J6A77_05180 [Lachnospiraceae bacterium]|nr:hypothetical protein [Lachnospiraceae bacterium]